MVSLSSLRSRLTFRSKRNQQSRVDGEFSASPTSAQNLDTGEGASGIDLNSPKNELSTTDIGQLPEATVLVQKHAGTESTSGSVPNNLDDTSFSINSTKNPEEKDKTEITFNFSDQRVYYEPVDETIC